MCSERIEADISVCLGPTEAGILVENFHRRSQPLKSTLNFLGKNLCIYLSFSDRDRSLKQVRTLGTPKFRPLVPSLG
jgi:hypothetical protein